MLHGLEGRPDLLEKTDDLEKQLRKYFYLPSFKLDFISDSLGFGGKDKMCFDDWINIVNKDKQKGLQAFKKMLKYCYKDVKDTIGIWKYCSKHFKSKFNHSTFKGDFRCIKCGSTNITRSGIRQSGVTKYQQYFCKDHGGYAGRKVLGSKAITMRL
jgi:hypothetical protein